MKNNSKLLTGLAAIQTIIAYEWLSAGVEKISSAAFVQGFAKTIAVFASHSPYGWYVNFLTSAVIPNAVIFSQVIQWSEFLIGAALFLTAVIFLLAKDSPKNRRAEILAVLALAGGILMNANFYLAAGWTGPGTAGMNVIMFWIQAILIYVWIYD